MQIENATVSRPSGDQNTTPMLLSEPVNPDKVADALFSQPRNRALHHFLPGPPLLPPLSTSILSPKHTHNYVSNQKNQSDNIRLQTEADPLFSTTSPLQHIHHQDPTTEKYVLNNAFQSNIKEIDADEHHDNELDSTSNQTSVLNVCKQCQHTLLATFDHCLSRHVNSAALTSIHLIDEVADAMPQRPVPYFDIIKDPTVKKPAGYIDPHEKVEQDRWVFQQQKASQAREDLGMNSIHKRNATHTIPSHSGHVVSGEIYKRMINARDKEIMRLRGELFSLGRKEQMESANVERLRAALNRSVYFYMFAEEWQQSESQRLQLDVQHLKTEVSSLMAFLINAEEEKRKLHEEIATMHQIVKSKDFGVKEAEKSVEEMKKKLQDSFKEFLAMDDTMTRLKKEAQRGTEAAESRNGVLQKNLEKLSIDFEQSAKELSISLTKIRELEFELDELVQQFNLCGEGKQKSEELNIVISSELATTTRQLHDAEENIQQLSMQKSKLEADLRLLDHQFNDYKKEAELRTAKITKESEAWSTVKKELEVQLKGSRSESEKLGAALKSLSRSKDQLEASTKLYEQKCEKEIASRDVRIKELGDLRIDDSKTIKKIQEQKEQLMFQTTDLQNQLDRELSNVNVLTFEMAQVRRVADEKAALLDEQIEKLSAAKSNLSNDKRQLTEKIKTTRADLRQKEDELTSINSSFTEYQEKAVILEAQLRQELSTLQTNHAQLTRDYKSLESKQLMVVDTNVKLKMKQDQMQKSQNSLEENLKQSRQEAGIAQRDNTRLSTELNRSNENYLSVQTKLSAAEQRVVELSEAIEILQSETSDILRERNNEIRRLSNLFEQAQLTMQRNVDTIAQLTHTTQTLQTQLASTQDTLTSETAHCEQLETALHENRLQYQSERKLRIEFERMKLHVTSQESTREIEMISEWRQRDRKLAEVATGLHVEYDRLSDFSKLLPTSKQLGNIELANTKEFEWLINDDAAIPQKSYRKSKKQKE